MSDENVEGRVSDENESLPEGPPGPSGQVGPTGPAGAQTSERMKKIIFGLLSELEEADE